MTEKPAKAYNERRSLARTHLSISLTQDLAKWVQDSAADRGWTVSAYLEGVLRSERERIESPKEPIRLVTVDPQTGGIIALPFRNA